jgi:galactofuranose transport system permease protein
MARTLRRLAPQIITLAALVALVTVFFPNFITITFDGSRFVGPIVDVLKRSAPIALLAVGMTLVIATRGIDLSVGTIMAIAGAVAAWAITSGLGLAGNAGPGARRGPCRRALERNALVAIVGIQPIVATLILMTSGRGIAQLITEGRILTFSDPGFAFIGSGTVFGIPFPTISGWRRRWPSRSDAPHGARAADRGDRRQPAASALAGVNATVILIAVYMASGLCAALAGIVTTADIRGADANNAGLWLELDAILAVVIGGNSLLGGRFSIAGSILGALIIQTINTGIVLSGFPSEYNLVIKAGLVIVILVLQSPNLSADWIYLRSVLLPRRAE